MFNYPLMEVEPEVTDIQPFGEDKVSICRAYTLPNIRKHHPVAWKKLIDCIHAFRSEGYEIRSMELFSSEYKEEERYFNMWTLEDAEI